MKEIDYDDELVELAEANGSGWHTALDLCSAVVYGVELLYAGPRKARFDEAARGLTDERRERRSSSKAEVASELRLIQLTRSRTSICRLETKCAKSSANSWMRSSACCSQFSTATISAIST